jgi:hypothetical protein
VPLTKTTIRALAASIAFIAAGATLAGAAVFHLPVLGFHSASVASATPPSTPRALTAHRKIAPRKIVRIRYVDIVVHRPAPPYTRTTTAAIATTYRVAPRPTAPVVTVGFAPALQPSASVARVRTAATSRGGEHDYEPNDHAPPATQGSASAPANGADQ